MRLAEAFGFCWGVERAVAMAYETRRHFPTERLWITNEIIHNPSVNDHLRQMDVKFIQVDQGVKDFSEVLGGDVVILPAFGATVQEMQLLNERGCHIVDTTCPWVSKVWNTVEKHKKHSFTSIIHGKVKHEETLATSSFAGTYLVVLDLAEAQLVCDYILGNGDRTAFMARFAKACSPGFDPDRDLLRLGVANQTTMLKSETRRLRRAKKPMNVVQAQVFTLASTGAGLPERNPHAWSFPNLVIPLLGHSLAWEPAARPP